MRGSAAAISGFGLLLAACPSCQVDAARIWPRHKLPNALEGVVTSNYGLEQQTFDVTKQTSASTLSEVIPGVFEPTELYSESEAPSTYSIAFAHLSPAAQAQSLRHNALFPVPNKPEPGNMYQYRFAIVPGEEDGAPTISTGLSEELGFSSGGWKTKCMCLGTQGNLQVTAALAKAKFTSEWSVGDIVDWFVEIHPEEEETIDAYIAINGISFGHAFHLDFKTSRSALNTSFKELVSHLRPMAGFHQDAHKTAVMEVNYPPVSLARLNPSAASYRRPSSMEEMHGRRKWLASAADSSNITRLLGQWVTATPIAPNNQERFDIQLDVSLNKDLAPDDPECVWLRVGAKILNQLIFNIEIHSNTGLVVYEKPGISTLMAGSPAIMEFENKFNHFVTGLLTIRSLANGNRLALVSKEEILKGQSMLEFTRAGNRGGRARKPATSANPFAAME